MSADLRQHTLWDFSVRLYAHAPVKAAALALQDAGLDVNLAFWIVWTAGQGRDPVAALDAALAARNVWHAGVVGKLREVRNGLKTVEAPFAQADALALRGQVLAAELEAERILQGVLAGLSAPVRKPVLPSAEAALAGLAHYAAGAGVNAPVKAFTEAVFSALEKE